MRPAAFGCASLGPPLLMLMLGGLMLMVAPQQHQQEGGGIFPAPELWLNGTCDVLTLHERVAQADAHCARGECGVDCIADLLPLVDSCRTLLYRLLDGLDGSFDGVYAPLAALLATCEALPPAQLLADLKLLNSEGRCPEELLDGVGTTEVKAPTCTDSWAGGRCAAVITTGALSCAVDFCDAPPTAAALCDLRGMCDRTCGLCADGEGEGEGEGGHYRRVRLQMSFGACDPSAFTEQAAAVDHACCGGDGAACASGTPDECDAKCAIVYTDFYRRCEPLLATLSPQLTESHQRLFATCERGLPSEPLLRAVASCASAAADPCAGVDCGPHGDCDGDAPGDPRCVCRDGHSGALCATAPDPCEYPERYDCGPHGDCDSHEGGDPRCVCRDGYSGALCATAPDPCEYPDHYDCGPHGDCDSHEGGDPRCVCRDGYSGALCATAPSEMEVLLLLKVRPLCAR
eukprot:SAG31_NODE_1022_length_10309_cov_9.623874_3_plen_460_part_00